MCPPLLRTAGRPTLKEATPTDWRNRFRGMCWNGLRYACHESTRGEFIFFGFRHSDLNGTDAADQSSARSVAIARPNKGPDTQTPQSHLRRAAGVVPSAPARNRGGHALGFTLIELLVAIAVMALLAVLSWRGLDGMSRAQTQTQARADQVLTLQAGLIQWGVDLDAVVQTSLTNAIDWDGRVLRITRRVSDQGAGLEVAAWTRRANGGDGQWLRWQSPPLATRGQLQQAWAQAALWAQNPGDAQKRDEVTVCALQDWQIFFFRGGAWTNPLSSDATTTNNAAPPSTSGTPTSATVTAMPDGVRMVLTLPPGQALVGTLTRDWVRPTLAGGKS